MYGLGEMSEFGILTLRYLMKLQMRREIPSSKVVIRSLLYRIAVLDIRYQGDLIPESFMTINI